MSKAPSSKIALVGNPNAGKSSLFNHLTGLNQKVGNFPGVTVEKKSGTTTLLDGSVVEVVDLPGIYSIYPRSLDEKIVSEILLDHHSPNTPDKVVVVADATNLKRGLLLATQVIDMGLPTILVLNMMDLAIKAGISYDFTMLSKKLGIPVVALNARKGDGIDELKKLLATPAEKISKNIFHIWPEAKEAVNELRGSLGVDNDYEAYLFLEQPQSIGFLGKEKIAAVNRIREKHQFFPGKFQGAETIQRYGVIQDLLNSAILKSADDSWKSYSTKIDRILTHKVWGYLIFFSILLVVFQSIFAWAEAPMDFIDQTFGQIASYLTNVLPAGPLTSLLTDGVIPGIGGIVIFVPQIAILFAFISILEESGYMARVVFLMDKIMRKFGLNGKSVVPLMSGVACAIPAIMATRTIDNWKERIITIMVTPLMSCSARLPIFAILIALIVPEQTVLGVFNLQGLAFMGLYLLGFVAAIMSAYIMKLLIRVQERSYLIMELPTYRIPKWSNVGYTIVEKTKAFVLEAGKIILAISIILWGLGNYGPGDVMENAESVVRDQSSNLRLTEQAFQDRVAAYKLENSYAGIIGKTIEPVIKPLGYDWKIGIALLTSFAAREVFVSTITTIYSIGSVPEDEAITIKDRLAQEVNPDTGGPRYTPAVGISLLVFYTFAMQCMSTLAIVYRETRGWKWPAIQLLYMTVLAYVSAFAVFQFMS
ncbi:ferrous iron transport protein B [Pseudochryseolinea flava]|uniref:Ferrous iron transport protein B n=1 Tax=Pseudochryseolinea flava TaxID=2059302 RepID=A0A364Y9D4_9BACT|nr:ferrous iron transport protein B [Pseudochryseolinea flava]RAW03075.1 ferrous iron transport protein B [Pseudochryseolinea flava]